MKTAERYIVKRESFERIEVVGPMAEGKRVLQELHDAGWRTTRSGPYTDREIFPRADINRFLFIAEREIK